MRRLVLLLLIPAAVTAARATDRCGSICTETWNAAGSPYVVTCDVTVGIGCTLTADAGVEVRFQAGTDLFVDGTLDVNGTSAAPVTFTSDAAVPAPGDWQAIRTRGSAVATLDFAVVEYGLRGLFVIDSSSLTISDSTVRFNDWGLWVTTGASATLQGVTVEGNDFDGVRVDGGAVTATGCTVTGNGRNGFLHEKPTNVGSSLTVRDSEIHSNVSLDVDTGTAFSTFSGQMVDARRNWWGTTDPAAIATAIRDHADDPARPAVDRCDYLDGPAGNPVVDAHCPDLAVCAETTTLALTDRPYLLTSDLVVCADGTLNLQPGVTLRFEPDPNRLELLVAGVLGVNGTAGSEVLLTSGAAVPAAGDWDGVDVREGGSAIAVAAVIEYADRGVLVADPGTADLTTVTTRSNTWGAWIDRTTATLDGLVSRSNDFDGLRVEGAATVDVTGASLTDNGRYGVYLAPTNGEPSFTMTASNLYGNLDAYDLFTASGWSAPASTIVVATDNWWGTGDEATIRQRIFDHEDDAGRPRVYDRAFGGACEFAVGGDRDGDGHGDFEDVCPADADPAQQDGDGDGMGDACDPAPATAPSGPCDGSNDLLDGWVDGDGDGWGDPCDFQPTRADSYPGAPELCDGRDNDGDALLPLGESMDGDFDLGLQCGDCDDAEPTVNVCGCEDCTNIRDDDCDGLADGQDGNCIERPYCIVLGAAADPTLAVDKGTCGGATMSGPFDVIRGDLAQVGFDSGSVDLGDVACVADNLAWDRVTDMAADPNPACGDAGRNYYLAQNDGAADFGSASSGEPRDTMNPHPPCP